MRLYVVVLLLFAVTVYALNKRVEQGTLRCFGHNYIAVIGGEKTGTNIDLSCPSCIQPQLCSVATDFCFRLSTSSVKVFQEDGTLAQPALQLPAGCMPLKMIEYEPGHEYIVQCESTPPLYTPKQVTIFRLEPEDNFEIEDEVFEAVELVSQDINFSPIPDNYRMIVDIELYTVALLQDSRLLFQNFNTFEKYVSIDDCDSVHSFIEGPVVSSNLQLIVDCNNTAGTEIRRRVLIPDDLRTPPTIEVLPRPLANDVVSFSPQGDYIVYKATSLLSLIPTNGLTETPGNLHFSNGPIAQFEFISESKLLISVPGTKRTLVDLTRFFASGFEEGRYELPDSTAVCLQGECPPIVYSNETLYLFNADPDFPSYQILSEYNINQPTASPLKISRLLRTAKFDTCFPVRAVITVIVEPSPAPPPPTPTPPPPITPQTPSIGGIQNGDDFEPLSNEVVIAIGCVVTLSLVAVCVIVIVIASCLFCHKKVCCKKLSSQIVQTTSGFSLHQQEIGNRNFHPSSNASSTANILTDTGHELTTPQPGSTAPPIVPAPQSMNISRRELFPSSHEETVGKQLHIPVPHPSHRTEQCTH